MSSYPTPIYPGIDPNDNYGPQLNTIGVTFICLSFVAITLRFVSRRTGRISWGLDDWLIILAAILSWAYTAGVINEVLYNFYGQHIGKTDPSHLEAWFKGLFAIAILYPIALTASKLSLLALLDRIFGVNKARIPMWIAAVLHVAWMISAIFVGVFSCNPVKGFWDLNVKSICIQEYDFFLANECITITLDLIVLMMPIYFISQIRRSLSQKISISSTFSLGFIATVVSVIRLWQLVVAQGRPGFDPTFNETGAALWAIIELNTWVVVSNIPTLRPLVTRLYTHLASGDARTSITFGSYTFGLIKWRGSRVAQSNNESTTPNAKQFSLQAHANPTPRGKTRMTHLSDKRNFDPYRSLLATETNREVNAELMELGNMPGIRVEHNFEVTRPEAAHHVV